MAFDGNGTFNRLYNWVQDAANGINITATRVDGEENGIAAGLSLAVTRDGQGKMAADFLPATDNTLNLGSGIKRWASFNGLPVPNSQAAIGLILNPQTPAELAQGVTPTLYFYPPGHAYRYNTKGDGVANDQPAIQAAINCGSSLTGTVPSGQAFLPPGTFLINSALTIANSGVTLRGSGANASYLYLGTTTQNGVNIGSGGANNPNNVWVKDLTIAAPGSNVQTAGTALNMQNGHHCGMDNVVFGYNLWTAIGLVGGAGQYEYFISNFEINNCNSGIVVGPGSSSIVQDVFISNGEIAGCAINAIFCGYVGGCSIVNVDSINCGTGLSTFPSAGQTCNAIHCTNVFMDTTFNNAWNIIENSGQVSEIRLTNCWASTAGAPITVTGASGTGSTATLTFTALTNGPPIQVGVSIAVAGFTGGAAGYNTASAVVTAATSSSISYANATTAALAGTPTLRTTGTAANNGMYIANNTGIVNGVTVSNGTMMHNYGAGVCVQGNPGNLIFNGNQVVNNSWAGSALRSGMELPAGLSNFIVANNVLGVGGFFGVSNNQAYGLTLPAGASTAYQISGNLCTGNVSGPMLISATPTVSGKVWGNPGYQTCTRGQGQILTGNSSVVVNHGLNLTPNIYDFILQGQQSKAAVGIADFWVSATTSTTFTVVSNVVTTGNFLFVFDVRSGGNQNA